MADSLVVANAVELLGGVPSEIPACAGAIFQLGRDWDLGAPQPTTDFVASLILDGEKPFGRRSSNRGIKLPVTIWAPDRLTLAAAREILETAIDQDRWTLTWTRDPGDGGEPLPLILDCFRAQASAPAYSIITDKQLRASITLTIPGLPYGRSDVQERVAFAAPVPSAPPPPPGPVVLDTFASVSSVRHYQSQRCVIGPQSLCWDPDDDRNRDPGGQLTAFDYATDLDFTANLTGMAGLQMFLGFGSRHWHCLEYHGHVHGVALYLTLVDASGREMPMSRSHLRLPVSPLWGQPVFTRVTMRLPDPPAGFDLTAVTGYRLRIVNRHSPPRLSWVTAYVDNLTAYPQSVTVSPVTRGAVHTLHGLKGTARVPVSMQFIMPPSQGTPTVLTTPGVGGYVVPAGTAWLKVEGTGAGAPGATRTTPGIGAGGPGAEYARIDVFNCQAGQVIPYSIGLGGEPGVTPVGGGPTIFGPGPGGTQILIANGAQAPPVKSTAGLPGASGSPNEVHYPGGAGRAATSGSTGTGGGSSAGYAGPGLTPTGTAAAEYTTPGPKTWICPDGVFQVFAENWGSGASGAAGAYGNGEGGSGAEYASGTVPTTPGRAYNFTVPAGGASVSNGQDGRDGAAMTFTGDAGVSVTANGGKAGRYRTSWGSGQGPAGGTGSAAPVHHPGGPGGPAWPYAGSGGSSAGPAAAGNPGSGYGGTTAAPAGGGQGGASSGTGSGPGQPGQAPGGGGGGTYSSAASGAGAAGKLRLSYPGGAPTSNGAAAPPGGGAGGAGSPTPGQPGQDGQDPGGGGGGGNLAGPGQADGGHGGDGKLVVTPFASQPFRSLIVHRPPLGAPKTLSPIVPVGGGLDVPDGTRQYQFPQPQAGVNADLLGTYTLLLMAASWSGGATSPFTRTVTVTITQWEKSGGTGWAVATIPVTLSPSQVVNGVVTAGVLTLPPKQVAPDNIQGYFTASVVSTNTGDRFSDLLLLDTMGQTIMLNQPSGGYIQYWADAPDPDRDVGYLLGSQTDRFAAISVLDQAMLSGGALHIEPADGDNQLVVYSPDGPAAPNVALAYYAGWFFDRTA
jgi:hypothetical protein